MPSSPSRSDTPRYGPKPRWPGPRKPCKIHFPESHRALYEEAAREQGVSLNEYVISYLAAGHSLPRSDNPGSSQLTLHELPAITDNERDAEYRLGA